MRKTSRTLAIATAGFVCLSLGGLAPGASAEPSQKKLRHLVVIYLENHSFDNLYGSFEGADGISQADALHTTQVDLAGNPLKCLRQNDVHLTSPPLPADACSTANGDAFNSHFPNMPFNIDQYIPNAEKTRDLVHRYYQNQVQINGGLNNKFTAVSDALGLTQGYYDTNNLPLAALASHYTVADNFFQAAFGGSFLNHQWLICACTPEWPGAPDNQHTILNPATGLPSGVLPNGTRARDGILVTAPENFAVNTVFSVNLPGFLPTPANTPLLPSQTAPTIGDRMDAADVDWAWYAGGWNDTLAGNPELRFQFHHQPFAYYENYKPGSPGGTAHLKDETEFMDSARNGTLPAVSFIKPVGEDNEHPGYADVARGEQHTLDLIQAVKDGPDWGHTAIVVTYDEFGGFWDHVPPPVVDRWGPGTRIPALVISPFAKKHFVDHTQYDTTSILATIEHRWNLPPLTSRDAAVADLGNALTISLTE